MPPDFESTIQQNVNILHKLCRVYSNDETEYAELFQDMLIQIWRALPKFRGEAQISTWLYRVCINTALGYRTRAKKISGKFVPLEETLTTDFSFDDEKDEQTNQLYRAVRELKPIDRAIVSLYLDEKSYDETAQILGITKTNVATRLMRLKEKLIEKLSVYE